MRYVDLDSLNHDPGIAEALGNMVVAWARAETQLANVFACVLEIHFNLAMAAFYRIPTFDARSKVLLAILKRGQAPNTTPSRLRCSLVSWSGYRRSEIIGFSRRLV